jgi:mRNA interferase HigB
MRVISMRLLRKFWERHADAEGPLQAWFRTAKSSEWRSLQDVRGTYSTGDGVPNRRGEILTVFNIGGNKYRLIARIRYEWRLINIRCVLTHREYDQGKWKE